MSSPPDPAARHVSPYGLREKLGRVLWSVVQGGLFRLSLPTAYGYRAWLLRRFGAQAHPTCRVRRTAQITCPWNLRLGANAAVGDGARLYCLGPLTLGARVTVSQHAHLCAGSHDPRLPHMPLLRPPIQLEDDAWIAADAFVGPGVRVGEGAILGARGCAFSDLEPWTVYGGNPAQPLKHRELRAVA